MKGFPRKLPHMSLKKKGLFNRKIHLPTIIFQRKIHQPNLHIWLMLWWMVSMKFVQGCHSSSQRGGAKSSGDPSGPLSWASFFCRKFSGEELTSEFIERELYGIRICQHKTILGPDLLSLAKKCKQISQQWMHAFSCNQCCLTMSFSSSITNRCMSYLWLTAFMHRHVSHIGFERNLNTK